MQTFSKPHGLSDRKLLLYFMLAWVALNLLQAVITGIDADEAYYWLYARQLQWGYFDHPPMVALFIKLGETFGHGPFYTRLATILFSAGTVWFGFKLLPAGLANVRLYLLIFSSAVLFHVYSFIATPDGFLLFFTTLFFYAYRTYLEKETAAHTLLLAVSITGLLYSKYHGILPVFFTVLSNPKLLLKPSAWIVALLVTLVFGPHLWWQFQHDWPTLRYHLSERMGHPYKFSRTGDYLAGQLFIWGLLTTIPALFLFIKRHKAGSLYERAHVFTFWGVLLFFLLSTWGNNIQLHWTLAAGPSFVVLLQSVLSNASLKQKKTFTLLFAINIFLILAARIVIAVPESPAKNVVAFRALVGNNAWADTVYRAAQGRPVVFTDSYRYPALYQYRHPNAKAWGYNTVNYRKTQFNIRSDRFLNNARVYLAGPDARIDSTNFLKTPYNTLYLRMADSFKAINALKLKWLNAADGFRNGERATAVLLLHNTGEDTISANGLSVGYTFFKTHNERYTPQSAFVFAESVLPPGYKKEIKLTLRLPPPGRYRVVFSLVQPPLAGNFASPFYKIRVN